MPIKVQGGKNYFQVSERLVLFEELYPEHVIHTDVEFMDGKQVIMRAAIHHPDGGMVTTGHAHARFGKDQFTDKVLEKAETCAVGRALAFLDTKLRGDEIASADEIVAAIEGAKYEAMTEEHAQQIFNLLDAVDIESGEGVEAFAESWMELDEDQKLGISPFLKAHYPGDISKTKEKMRQAIGVWRRNNEEIANAV